MVIQFCDDDFVAGLVVASKRAREVKCEAGHVRAENNLVRRSVQKLRDDASPRFDYRVGFGAGRIGPVGVGVVVVKVIIHGLDYRAWHLRSAGSIKVGHSISVVSPPKGWKKAADLFSR